MENRFYNEESLVRYLLGQLSEEEQMRIEEKYFDDQEWFAQLEVIESELIDSYIRHQLSEKDCQSFENFFSQLPERRRKIAFAQAFQLFVEQKKEPQSIKEKAPLYRTFLHFIGHNRLSFASLVLVLLLLPGCFWLVFDNMQLRNRLQQVQTGASEIEKREQDLQEKLRQERQQVEQLAKDLENERNRQVAQDPSNPELPSPLAQIVSFILTSDTVRSSGGIKKLEISPATQTIRFIMSFTSDENKEVFATMKRVGSEDILQRAQLKTQTKGSKSQVIWSLPAKSLDKADYMIILNGKDENGATVDIERYAFRVIKK
jgi:cell division protein FtsB